MLILLYSYAYPAVPLSVHRTPAGFRVFFVSKKRTPPGCWTPRSPGHHAHQKSALLTFNHDKSTTMPRKSTLNYERRVAEAVKAYNLGQFSSIAAAAREFRVVRRTLSDRLHGKPPLTAKKPTNKGLNPIQEDTLLWWIKFLDDTGFSPTKPMVVAYANEIRMRDEPGIPVLSRKWAARWFKAQRKIGLVIKKTKSIEVARQAAFDKPSIVIWFGKLHKIYVEKGLQADDIINFDETGYRIGVAGDQDITTFHPERQSTLPNDMNHEHITLTETILAAGWVIPPVITSQGSVHLQRHFQDLPDRYLLSVSDSGYINDEILIKTLKHINQFTKLRMKGKYRLLLLDNHECHLSLEFREYCEAEGIIPFTLLPHTTHFLQPLNVGCFQPNKHYHREAVNEATRMGNRDYNRMDFFVDIERIRHQTFKELTIKSAFKKTGIWPFNPEIVLQKLKEFEPPHHTPPLQNQDELVWWDFRSTVLIKGTVRSPENAAEFMALG